MFYDESILDAFHNADKVLKDFLFFTRRRRDLEELNDVVQ